MAISKRLLVLRAQETFDTKYCTRCCEYKAITLFPRSRQAGAHKGVHATCYSCRNTLRRKKDAPHFRGMNVSVSDMRCKEADNNKYCTGCGQYKDLQQFAKHPTAHKKCQNRCKACNRREALERDFGMTGHDYEVLLVSQGGVCGICKCPPHESRYGCLAVDHDHVTGLVRGLLCDQCNTGLGKFNDDCDVLHAAIEYVRRAECLTH